MGSSSSIPHIYSLGEVSSLDWNSYINKRNLVAEIDHTDSPYTVPESVGIIEADTDGGAITIIFPAGKLRDMIETLNVGSSGNDITLTPDGVETINGESSEKVHDGESLQNVWSTTHFWRSK